MEKKLSIRESNLVHLNPKTLPFYHFSFSGISFQNFIFIEILMGRKRLYETTDDKKQAQHEYYDKTKDEYKRFYQLASKKYMMNKQLKKCEEKLNVLHVNMEDSKAIQLQTQMKIDKLKARIAKYKEQLPSCY
jgi:hypothetical protein